MAETKYTMPVRNPFRNPTMRGQFAALIHCYEIKHRDLIRSDGSRNTGNSLATNFWRGYDNSRPEQWDAESRKMLAYSCYRAGQLIRKYEEQ